MKHQETLIESGKTSLVGRIFTPPRDPSGSAVLFIHGQGSSQEGYADRAEQVTQSLGTICLTFDLSGHGLTRKKNDHGHPTLANHVSDVQAAYDYLAAYVGVDGTRVGVCGASYGGYLAALLADQRDVKRLLLRAPALPLNRLDLLRRYRGEVLIIESELDETVPSSHISAYLDASPGAERYVIQGATHALTERKWKKEFIDEIIRWFTKL